MNPAIIRKTDKISETEEILKNHGLSLGHGWALIMGMMLSDCEYVELHGFGSNAYFNKIYKEDTNEAT